MEASRSFWAAGGAALGLYVALLAAVALMLYESPVALSPLDGGEVSVEIQEPLAEAPQRQSAPVVAEDSSAKSETPAKESNSLGSLFGSLDFGHKESPLPKAPDDYGEEIASRIKTRPQPTERQKSLPPRPKLEAIAHLSLQSTPSSAGQKEYFYQVGDIIRRAWEPKAADKGLSAIVALSVRSDGRFSFEIVRSSGNGAFDRRLSQLLEALARQALPPPTEGRAVSFRFNFKATAEP